MTPIDQLMAQIDWKPIPYAASAEPPDDLPYATHTGVLHLPGVGALPCVQLNTGQRVFEAEAFERLFDLGEE